MVCNNVVYIIVFHTDNKGYVLVDLECNRIDLIAYDSIQELLENE